MIKTQILAQFEKFCLINDQKSNELNSWKIFCNLHENYIQRCLVGAAFNDLLKKTFFFCELQQNINK